MKKVNLCIVAMLLVAVLAVGCSAPTPSPTGSLSATGPSAPAVSSVAPSATPTGEATPSAEPTTMLPGETEMPVASDGKVTSRDGKEYDIKPINKIISVSPANTEILSGLGLLDKVVAIDMFSTDIPGLVEGIPQLDMLAPDAEKILSLQPDAIFASDINIYNGGESLAAIEKAGVQVIYVPNAESVDDIKKDIQMIAALTGTADKGSEICAEMEKMMEDIRLKVLLSSQMPSVYFEISPAPDIYAAGSGNFIHELIGLAGGINIFEDIEGYFAPSAEEIIKKNPDIILTSVNYIDKPIEEILSRPGFDSIKAVKDKKVVLIDTNAISRPSQNVVKAFYEMAMAIQPNFVK